MNKDLQLRTQRYVATLQQAGGTVRHFAKTGAAGAAALATVMLPPVELSSQVVCGNLGAPTVATGNMVGGTGNLGAAYGSASSWALRLDFDGDGNDELQIKYYNYNGYPAYAYFDPIDRSIGTLYKGSYANGVTFPANLNTRNDAYFRSGFDKIYVVPLTGGNGFGFVTVNNDFYNFTSGTHQANHPVTGQPICCTSYGKIVAWGAQTGLSSFGDIQIQSADLLECPSPFANPLPVELAEFTATTNQKQVSLYWRTATESDNAGFEVERSTDGETFRPIHFETGAGTTPESQQYRFTDRDVTEGNQYYYRLKQVDYDGSFAYSNIESARLEGTGLQVSVAPNPMKERVTVELPLTDASPVQMELFASDGRPVYRRELAAEAGLLRHVVATEGLAQGVYFLKVTVGDRSSYERLVK